MLAGNQTCGLLFFWNASNIFPHYPINMYTADTYRPTDFPFLVESSGKYRNSVLLTEFPTKYKLPFSRLSSQSPAYPLYKAARVFDPRQLPTLYLNIETFKEIKGFQYPSPTLLRSG